MKDNGVVIVFKIMKWCVKMILVIFGVIPLARCSSGYSKKDGKITFNGKEIDDKNFVVLSEEFAKDSTTAYYKQYPFSYADVASFVAVDEHYAKDKNKVYFCDEYREGQNYYLTKKQTIKELKAAIPASFVSLKYGYGKDGMHAYFEGVSFPVKNVSSLSAIDNHFAKDDVEAYLNCKTIAGSHGKTFELIDNNFAKDTAHIYYYGYTGEAQHNICTLPCDKASFEILDYRYSKDKNNVFFLGFTIKGADAASFKILNNEYSADKNAVYFKSKKMDAVSPAGFKVYAENDSVGHDVVFARNDVSVFVDDKILTGADVASFKVLGENYGSDNNHVFYKAKLMKDANPASFKVYPHDFGNADSEDAAAKFHEGKKVVDE